MAYQLSDIVTKVQQRVKDTSYSTAEIKNYINDTQNDVFNEYRLPFMEASQTYTLSTSSSDITNGSGLPSDYVQALNLTITTQGSEQVVPYSDIRDIDELYPDPDDTTAHPAGSTQYLTHYNGTLRVFPTPDRAYTATLRYYKKPTILEADGSVPEIPSEFEELLVVGSAYRVLQVKDNYDQAGILENKYMELLDKLVQKYSSPYVGRPHLMRINRYATSSSLRKTHTSYR